MARHLNKILTCSVSFASWRGCYVTESRKWTANLGFRHFAGSSFGICVERTLGGQPISSLRAASDGDNPSWGCWHPAPRASLQGGTFHSSRDRLLAWRGHNLPLTGRQKEAWKKPEPSICFSIHFVVGSQRRDLFKVTFLSCFPRSNVSGKVCLRCLLFFDGEQ